MQNFIISPPVLGCITTGDLTGLVSHLCVSRLLTWWSHLTSQPEHYSPKKIWLHLGRALADL